MKVWRRNGEGEPLVLQKRKWHSLGLWAFPTEGYATGLGATSKGFYRLTATKDQPITVRSRHKQEHR
jgi:hypothetical protein